jgi:hypothetical protein
MSSEMNTATSGAPQNAAGETQSHENNRGRRFNNRRWYSRTGNRARGSVNARFEGREPSLKGHIYDWTGERNPDQFIKTTKEIINYVGRTYTKYTGEFMEAVRDLVLEDPPQPEEPEDDTRVAFEMWRHAYKEQQTKLQEYKNFCARLYNVVFGQCSDALQDKLKSHADFPAAYQDGIALLTIIKVITYSFKERRKLADALCEIKEAFFEFKQGNHMSLQRYYELFLNHVEVMKEVGVTIADEGLINEIAGVNEHDEPTKEDRMAAEEQTLAVRFLHGANQQHKSYLTHLQNSFLDRNDKHSP